MTSCSSTHGVIGDRPRAHNQIRDNGVRELRDPTNEDIASAMQKVGVNSYNFKKNQNDARDPKLYSDHILAGKNGKKGIAMVFVANPSGTIDAFTVDDNALENGQASTVGQTRVDPNNFGSNPNIKHLVQDAEQTAARLTQSGSPTVIYRPSGIR